MLGIASEAYLAIAGVMFFGRLIEMPTAQWRWRDVGPSICLSLLWPLFFAAILGFIYALVVVRFLAFRANAKAVRREI